MFLNDKGLRRNEEIYQIVREKCVRSLEVADKTCEPKAVHANGNYEIIAAMSLWIEFLLCAKAYTLFVLAHFLIISPVVP